MYAMSKRTDQGTRGEDTRQPRTFSCRDDLFRAFEARARELGCSVDWLLAEAMKAWLQGRASAPPRLPPPSAFPPPPRRRAPPIALRAGDARVVVDRDRFVIGRSAREAHFVVRDPGVSRQHAIIERALGGWRIVDMASTNGLTLNGAAVTSAPLRPGDVVVVGEVTLTVERA
jgi:hypothetical protein